MIAGEFSEATGDMYLSALIEIGLALFLVTIVVNAIARALVWAAQTRHADEGALDEHKPIHILRRLLARGGKAAAACELADEVDAHQLSGRRYLVNHLVTGLAVLSTLTV